MCQIFRSIFVKLKSLENQIADLVIKVNTKVTMYHHKGEKLKATPMTLASKVHVLPSSKF
jgi:hypothetical protein